MVTPFDDNGAVDFAALGKLVHHVSDGGVDYLVALGTTAETPTLNFDEKNGIIACVRQNNKRSLPLVVGVGGNDTQHVIDDMSRLDLAGAAAVLSVTPYYNRPSQRGLYEHFKAIAAAAPAPVLLYNVPSRTGVNMTADTTLRLAHEVKNICGIKEACGTINQMAYLLKGRPRGFVVLSGDDAMTLPLLSIGGDGVISVLSNAFPAPFTQMVSAFHRGDIAGAAALQMRLLEVTDALFEEGNPVGIETALAALGMIQNVVHLPLVKGSDALLSKFRRLTEENRLF